MPLFALAFALASAAPQSAPDGATDPTRLDDVVVTGSHLRTGTPPPTVQTLAAPDLEAAGVLDPSRLVALITANAGSEAQVDQLNDPQSSGVAQVNLRNLGLGSTLVLLNGRRQTHSAVVSSDGTGFTDINSLTPLIALERIDVLKDGASATYGSDAVAGVVNFVTRTDVEAPELRARHALIDGASETLVEGLAGGSVFGGELVAAASAFHRSALGTDERGFTQAERYGRAGWTAVTSYGQPGSYFRPGANAFAPDPDCDDPAFVDAFRTGPADVFCRLDYSDFFDLAPEEDRRQAFAGWRGEVQGVRLGLEAAWTGSRTLVRQSPSLPILAGSPVVPAAHPDNPFGEAVLFRGRLLGAEAGASSALFDYDTRRVAADLQGDLRNGWTWSAAAAWSRQTVFYDKPDVIASRLASALNGLGGPACAGAVPGAGGCQWFNPFGSAWLGTGTPNDPALVDWLTGSTGLRGAASLWSADVLLTGDVWRGAEGRLSAAFGAQTRTSRLRHDWSDLANAGELLTAGASPDFEGDQRTTSLFGEARLEWRALEVQAAARAERWTGADARLSPEARIVWTATPALRLHAGYGEGFKAPSDYARSGAQASQPSVFDRGAFVFVNTVTHGVSDLRPERSRDWTAGLSWSTLLGLTLSLDAWRYDVEDMVIKESAQAVIDRAGAGDPDAQGRVERDPSGALRYVELRFVNAAAVTTAGIDLAAGWSRELGDAVLSARAAWTRVDRYDIRMTPGAPPVSAVGRTNLATTARSLPRDRADLTVTLERPSRAVSGRLAYVSGYENDRAGVSLRRVRSQLTIDLGWTEHLAKGWSASLHVANAFDAEPPLVQYPLGYDPIVHDPRGRIVTVGLGRTF